MTTVDSKVPEFKSEIFSSTGFILFTLIVVTVSSLAGLAEIMCILKQRRSETHDKDTVATETFRGEKFLRCFSLRENVPRVLQATAPKEFVSILAGLRTIVCLWVTLLHIFYFSMFTMDNILFLYATGETFIQQPVFQACYYVDVFFTVSAFLMTYNLLSNKQRVCEIKSNKWFQNLKLYMKFVIHRIFRLTPVLVLTLVASDFVYDIVDMSSPFYLNEDHDLYCKKKEHVMDLSSWNSPIWLLLVTLRTKTSRVSVFLMKFAMECALKNQE
ncbi:unnamed protein product [Hermetia illucens]|uniref:Acyltransferase 3 domain-containing protein n=1 Tax=Hermetia illucens TaxID=343691 RepID=A0A7R8UD75_HERIL|nr:unnamed protein product [Hermetia illucens]